MNKHIVYMSQSYNIECDWVWHYIVPHDGGQTLTDGKCNCDESR